MTTITQADRDAAFEVFEALLVATEPTMMTPDECQEIIVQAFARHREQAEAATVAGIVAWLRESAAWHDKNDDGLSGFDGICQGQTEAADAIEAGEWKE